MGPIPGNQAGPIGGNRAPEAKKVNAFEEYLLHSKYRCPLVPGLSGEHRSPHLHPVLALTRNPRLLRQPDHLDGRTRRTVSAPRATDDSTDGNIHVLALRKLTAGSLKAPRHIFQQNVQSDSADRGPETVLTIKTWMRGIGRRSQQVRDCPFWPPDLFGITGALLKRSGAYLRVFEHDGLRPYLAGIQQGGRDWRLQIDHQKKPTIASLIRARPPEVMAAWKKLIEAESVPVSRILEHDALAETLIQMALIADAASAGLGVDAASTDSPHLDRFLSLANSFNAGLRGFSLDLPEDVICVLGKQHTPQRGATFRSLTHHLSLHLSSDIEARWAGPYPQRRSISEDRGMLNVLLLPWPVSIRTEDFSEIRRHEGAPDDNTGSSYFAFQPRNVPPPGRFARAFQLTLEAARQHAQRIDAVVFPELAMTLEQYRSVERIAIREGVLLVSGVRRAAKGTGRDANLCILQPAGTLADLPEGGSARQRALDNLRLVQSKHHRWCLDREQIVSYQLGGRLPASRSCWENIELARRTLLL